MFVLRCIPGLVGRYEERDHLEGLGVDGGNINMDIQEVGWGNEPWGSIKCG